MIGETIIDVTCLAALVCFIVEISGAKVAIQRATGKASILPFTSVTAMTFIVCTTYAICAGVWTFALQAYICLLSALSLTFCRIFLSIIKKLTK